MAHVVRCNVVDPEIVQPETAVDEFKGQCGQHQGNGEEDEGPQTAEHAAKEALVPLWMKK
jgi:hypothetical protein